MSQPYIAEIRIFGFNFAQQGWAACSGQLIAISQNTALYQIIGTTYGGDGVQTFALPNLQERVVVHQGSGSGLRTWVLGQTSGEDNHTLLISEVPAHTHQASAGNGVAFASQTAAPTAASFLGREKSGSYAASATTTLSPAAIGIAGGSLPHSNQLPTLGLTFNIALFGVFPTQ